MLLVRAKARSFFESFSVVSDWSGQARKKEKICRLSGVFGPSCLKLLREIGGYIQSGHYAVVVGAMAIVRCRR